MRTACMQLRISDELPRESTSILDTITRREGRLEKEKSVHSWSERPRRHERFQANTPDADDGAPPRKAERRKGSGTLLSRRLQRRMKIIRTTDARLT